MTCRGRFCFALSPALRSRGRGSRCRAHSARLAGRRCRLRPPVAVARSRLWRAFLSRLSRDRRRSRIRAHCRAPMAGRAVASSRAFDPPAVRAVGRSNNARFYWVISQRVFLSARGVFSRCLLRGPEGEKRNSPKDSAISLLREMRKGQLYLTLAAPVATTVTKAVFGALLVRFLYKTFEFSIFNFPFLNFGNWNSRFAPWNFCKPIFENDRTQKRDVH